MLDRLSRTHGLPQALVMDYGPEFTSKALAAWAKDSGVRLHFITPGKPTENGYIGSFTKSFNGKFRGEYLNPHLFLDLENSRVMIEDWRTDYNRDGMFILQHLISHLVLALEHFVKAAVTGLVPQLGPRPFTRGFTGIPVSEAFFSGEADGGAHLTLLDFLGAVAGDLGVADPARWVWLLSPGSVLVLLVRPSTFPV